MTNPRRLAATVALALAGAALGVGTASANDDDTLLGNLLRQVDSLGEEESSRQTQDILGNLLFGEEDDD